MYDYIDVFIGILIGMSFTGSYAMAYIVKVTKQHNILLRGMLDTLDDTVDRVHKFDQIMKVRKN